MVYFFFQKNTIVSQSQRSTNTADAGLVIFDARSRLRLDLASKMTCPASIRNNAAFHVNTQARLVKSRILCFFVHENASTQVAYLREFPVYKSIRLVNSRI